MVFVFDIVNERGFLPLIGEESLYLHFSYDTIQALLKERFPHLLFPIDLSFDG